ncbi:MAG TPA: SEC-C metal-binding domain-containing protein, partial [Acidimicrobiales bacterium]|nr:SEC-C metal-binding domain-containing protein [Acidimicrobiales bacterium]
PAVSNVQYSAPEDPAGGGSSVARAATATAAPAAAATEAPMQPTVKSEWEKTPRNAPCPCGSGKKFKFCHGRS